MVRKHHLWTPVFRATSETQMQMLMDQLKQHINLYEDLKSDSTDLESNMLKTMEAYTGCNQNLTDANNAIYDKTLQVHIY